MNRAHTGISASAYRTLASFRDAVVRYDRASLQHIQAADLTSQQYALLVHVAGHLTGTPSVGELAESMLLGHNSVVELSQRAERNGLLQRAVDPARGNRTLLILTAEGARRVDEVTRALVLQLGQERTDVRASLSRWEATLRSQAVQAAFLNPQGPAALVPDYALRPAAARHQALTWTLLQHHLHALSPYHHVPMTASGEYRYPPFKRYWQGGPDHAQLLWVNQRPAGFVLLRQARDATRFALSELSVVPAWQGRGLGRSLARDLLGARRGTWTVDFHRENGGARRFWERVLDDLHLEVTSVIPVRLPLGGGERWQFTVPPSG